MDNVALIGPDTLLGREIRDLWPSDAPAGVDLKFIASEDDEIGKITRQDDEAAFIARLDAASLEGASAVLLASPLAKAVSHAGRLPVIDMTGVVEDHPRARLRAPLAEHTPHAGAAHVAVIAHPAAIAIAPLIGHIHQKHPIVRSLVNVFEPASERGRAGIDEIQQQTVNLLSFKGLPKAVYDTQAAFALLAAFGEEAPLSLEHIELRVERHTASLLAGWNAPMPSLRLIQAPVFHGHSFSFWIEFENNPGTRAIEQTLAAAGFEVFLSTTEPPNNVGIAGQTAVAAGGIREDRNNQRACWIWAAADNVRLSAANALAVLKELV